MKKRQIETFLVESPWGSLQVIYSEEGIYALKKTSRKIKGSQKLPILADECRKALKHYFEGKADAPFSSLIIDYSDYTDFQKKVLRALSKVRHGKVLSYADLAKKSGVQNGARAIGHVMSLNRTPILLPCHRIVRKDGGMGGFAYGLSWKKSLLKHEGIEF